AVVIEASAADAVVQIVSDEHPAHAEVVIKLHHARLVVNRVRAFDVEHDTQASAAARSFDVRDVMNEHIVLRMREQPAAEMREHANVRFDALLAEADVDAQDVDSASPKTFEL